jgi:hypothetical protein
MTRANSQSIVPAAPNAPQPALQNPAVARCCDALDSTLKACTINGDVLPWAYIDAYKAFHAAMPPLSGYQNICDFIACVAHGMLIGAIQHTSGTKFIYAAQVAFSTVRRQPKEQSKKQNLQVV